MRKKKIKNFVNKYSMPVSQSGGTEGIYKNGRVEKDVEKR